MTVKRRKLPTKPAQVQASDDGAQKMIGRNPILKTELIEKTVLPSNLFPHHRFDLPE